MTVQRQHLIYPTDGEIEAQGYACRRCSLWARIRSLFSLLPCPPPGGR